MRTKLSLLTIVLSTMVSLSSHAIDRFVATTGADVGDCSNSLNPCLTFSYTIGQALAGDTLFVAAGIYNFAAVADINKQLNIRGAQADVDARTRVGASESILTGANGVLSASANGIIINGFTIEGQTNGLLNGGAVWFKDTFSGYRFINNIGQNNIFAVYGNSEGTTQSVFRQNLFQNNNTAGAASGNGIYSDFGSHNILIEDNLFAGNNNCGVTYDTFQEANTDMIVQNNEFQSNGGGVCLFNTDGADILDNDIFGSDFSGIVVAGNVADILIQDNRISTSGNRAVRVGAAGFTGTPTDVSVIMNQLVDNGAGILVDSDTTNLQIHFNRIFDNVNFGLNNTSAQTIAAENNWWGCNDGPNDAGALCDTVMGDVDFDPWLVLRLLADPMIIDSNASSALTANLLLNSDDVDTSAQGNIPDETPVNFSAVVGSVNPTSTVTTTGQANSTFSPGGTSGDEEVCTNVDNQDVCVTIEVTAQVVTPTPVASPSPTPTAAPGIGLCLQGSGIFAGTGHANCEGFTCSLNPGPVSSRAMAGLGTIGLLLSAGAYWLRRRNKR